MITTFEEYRKNYLDLLDSNDEIPTEDKKMVNPESEQKFIIDANTRTIVVPEMFKKGIAVYKDYKSETLFFEINRYFDDIDLYDKTCAIQIYNAQGEYTALPASYKYLSDDNKKVIIGWTITQEVTVKDGPVTFSIRFFSLDKDGSTLSYNWSTLPVTVNVYAGLYVMEGTQTIPTKTTLELLLDQITSLWANGTPSFSYGQLTNKPTINGAEIVGDISQLILALVSGDSSSGKFLTINDVLPALDQLSNYPVASHALWGKFETQDVSLSDLDAAIEALREEMDGMSFIPITIEEFTILPPTNDAIMGNKVLVENGQKISDIYFSWKLDRMPVSIYIDDIKINTPSIEGNIELTYKTPITTNREFVLIVGDKKGDPVKAYAKMIFCNKAYYGVRDLVTEDEVTVEFIKDDVMERRLTIDKNMTFDVDITEGKYLYIALPTSLGAPFQFSVDGLLKGGFDYVKTMTLPCANDYTAEYMVYRSTNPSLGQVQILVS